MKPIDRYLCNNTGKGKRNYRFYVSSRQGLFRGLQVKADLEDRSCRKRNQILKMSLKGSDGSS